jgi:chemotaxis protein MotB
MSFLKKRHEEHENHERWLVSYADFITLLFAFFTVLYATSQQDLKKQEEFQESIKSAFAAYVGVGGSGSQILEESDVQHKSLIKPPIETFPPMGAATREVEEVIERRMDKSIPKEERENAGMGLRHDSVGVRIQMASTKLFAPGSAELKSDSAASLDKVGELLRDTNRRLIVEGHTDDQPIRTDRYPSNWELSAARATKIVRYLAARHKIPPSKLTAVAYADQRPLAPNTSEENRAKNRRIEIMIVTGSSEL